LLNSIGPKQKKRKKMTKLPIRKTTRLTGYDFNNVELDEYIIMPNHIHGIINIVRAADLPPLQYKNNDQLQQPIWHRSFYDHIIQNETSLNKIREYIINNPITWDNDEYNNEKTKYVGAQYFAPGTIMKKKMVKKKIAGRGISKKTNVIIAEIRSFIESARGRTATYVNVELTVLYWKIGARIRGEILKEKRAEYGKEIVVLLSRQLVID